MSTMKMTNHICQVAAPLLATLALHLITSTASAAESIVPDGLAHPVSLADLDLATPQDQAIARARVQSMARTLCDRIRDEQDLGQHEHYLRCVADATDKAMAQILNPALAGAAISARDPQATSAVSLVKCTETAMASAQIDAEKIVVRAARASTLVGRDR